MAKGIAIPTRNSDQIVFNPGGTGAVDRTAADIFADKVSVQSYGAKADLLTHTDGEATATDATFTSAGAAWVTADIGKIIGIEGAGTAGALHSTTIASINSTTSIELTDVAVTTVSSAEYYYGTDDTGAFNDAITANLHVHAPAGNYLFTGIISMLKAVNLTGEGSTAPSAAAHSNIKIFGTTRFVFAGAGAACIDQDNKTVSLQHGSFANITFQTAAGSTRDWIMDFVQLLSWDFANLRLENSYSAGGCLKSTKLVTTNSSWVNNVHNCQFRCIDSSTAYVVDTDWSDSFFTGGSVTGGLGTVNRGSGGNLWHGVRFDRSSYASLHLRRETTTNAMNCVTGCQFDEHFGLGLLIEIVDTTNTRCFPSIVGNTFRGPNGSGDIEFRATTSGMKGGSVVGNCFTESGVTEITTTTNWKGITFAGNSYNDQAVDPFTFDTRDQNFYCNQNGINIQGPIIAKTSKTIKGMANCAAFFGTAGDAQPGVMFGTLNATKPFIAASVDAAGDGTDLYFYTDNTLRLSLTADGDLLPISANLSLGGTTNRFGQVWASKMYIGTSVSVSIESRSGTPEGSLAAVVGSICTRTDGGAGTTLYVKESGTGNTGWVAK